jgi:hypothetical protein
LGLYPRQDVFKSRSDRIHIPTGNSDCVLSLAARRMVRIMNLSGYSDPETAPTDARTRG